MLFTRNLLLCIAIKMAAKRHILHPGYNPFQKEKQGIKEYYQYDVALIELVKYVEFNRDIR